MSEPVSSFDTWRTLFSLKFVFILSSGIILLATIAKKYLQYRSQEAKLIGTYEESNTGQWNYAFFPDFWFIPCTEEYKLLFFV